MPAVPAVPDVDGDPLQSIQTDGSSNHATAIVLRTIGRRWVTDQLSACDMHAAASEAHVGGLEEAVLRC